MKMSVSRLCGIMICLMILGVPSLSARVWHVCMACPESSVQTIQEALRACAPEDTIVVYWETQYPYYLEHLVIDKPVRLISNTAAGDLTNFDLYPVITSGESEIIRVTVPGVELIGFNITHMKPPTIPDGDRKVHFQVGIRLEAPAHIKNCAFTNCGTGILINYHTNPQGLGSVIENCRIGLPADHAVKKGKFKTTQNYFGIAILPVAPDMIHQPILAPDLIRNCTIMRNYYYGVVYPAKNAPNMEQCIVELNGKRPFRLIKDLSKDGSIQWMDTDP